MPFPPIKEILVAVLIGFIRDGFAIFIQNRLYPLICDVFAMPVTVIFVVDTVDGSASIPV